jgi:DNA modification methylase
MAKKAAAKPSVAADVSPRQTSPDKSAAFSRTQPRPSALLDTRVVYCGDNLVQLAKLPDACVDLIYIDPPFNSNRNYGPCRTGQFWGLPREIMPRATTPHRLHPISRGETKEKRAFEDRHENTKAYIDYLRPRCVQLARVLKQTGSFYYHCDWHASHYVRVMLDQIFGENNFQNEIASVS